MKSKAVAAEWSASSWTMRSNGDLYGRSGPNLARQEQVPETVKEVVARRHGLKVVNKEIQIPTCVSNTRTTPTWRFTRETWNSRRALPPRGLAAKARAGFQILRPAWRADRLRAFAMNAN